MRYQDKRGWLYEVRQGLQGEFKIFYRKPRANPDLSIGWHTLIGCWWKTKDIAEFHLQQRAEERGWKAVSD